MPNTNMVAKAIDVLLIDCVPAERITLGHSYYAATVVSIPIQKHMLQGSNFL
jgi:cellulose biosynthesis protein BcsQ